jgi:hypothetical protein
MVNPFRRRRGTERLKDQLERERKEAPDFLQKASDELERRFAELDVKKMADEEAINARFAKLFDKRPTR